MPDIIKNYIKFKTQNKKKKIKTKDIETWKTKTQKDENLVFQKKSRQKMQTYINPY